MSERTKAALGKKTPSVLAKTEGAIKVTPDEFTYLDPGEFPKLFAPDLPREQAEFDCALPGAGRGQVFSTPLTAAAWKTKPSWGIVAGNDQIINPDLERWYYERAKSHTTVIQGASHSVYESHPKEVAAVITNAARSVQQTPRRSHTTNRPTELRRLTAFPLRRHSPRSGYFHMLMSRRQYQADSDDRRDTAKRAMRASKLAPGWAGRSSRPATRHG